MRNHLGIVVPRRGTSCWAVKPGLFTFALRPEWSQIAARERTPSGQHRARILRKSLNIHVMVTGLDGLDMGTQMLLSIFVVIYCNMR